MIESTSPAPNTTLVLDHGYVTLRNLAGPTRRQVVQGLENEEGWLRAFDADDTDVANAARMSFGQSDGDRTYEQEMKLTKYLWVNHHATPFESIVVWLEYKLPIFCARQFHRHRTQSINEISGRYVTLPEEWYIPEVVGGKAADKKQGQSDDLDQGTQNWFKEKLRRHCQSGYDAYLEAIEEGVAPEHARMLLSLNHYTKYLSTVNLRNLLGFMLLRDHKHAQVEAQAYAKAIIMLLKPHIPGIMGVWENFRQEAL